MSREEIEYIPKNFKTALGLKWDLMIAEQAHYKECWDQVIIDRYKRSDAVLKHKIQKL